MYLGPYQRPSQLHSATAQQSPQGSSMKGHCAVVGIGTTAVLHSVLIILIIISHTKAKTHRGIRLELSPNNYIMVEWH